MVNAISRQKKEKIVGDLNALLENSNVAIGINYKGLTVADIQKFRRALPEDAKFMVAKNSLMGVAVKDNEKWAGLAGQDDMTGWLFAGESISKTTKAYLDFKKAVEKENKSCEVKVGVLDGQVLDMAGVERLKDLPTKEELYTKIAVGVKAVPTKIALGVKAVPTKLARAINLVAELDEDKSKTVAEMVGKGPGKAE